MDLEEIIAGKQEEMLEAIDNKDEARFMKLAGEVANLKLKAYCDGSRDMWRKEGMKVAEVTQIININI